MKTNILIGIIFISLFCSISGIVSASDQIIDIQTNNELTLNFPGSRVKVEGWNGDYVKIATTYLVKKPFNLDIKNNTITFNKKEHLQKYPGDLDNNSFVIPNEVYFIIYVPLNVTINVIAESANIKNGCRLKSLLTRTVRIRDCELVNGFIGKGEKMFIKNSHFAGESKLDFEYITRDNYRSLWKLVKRLLS